MARPHVVTQCAQLKDSFGGVGAAAKAVGGYVAGLVGPFTLAAAGVGVLTAAWVQGSSEAEAYEKTLAITGYRAGVTASELSVVAESIGKVSGTQGSAAEILNQLAGSGKVAAGQMEEVGAAISAMAETGARDVETLVKEFAAIAEDPVKGILKMNDAYNFLTPTIYGQVKALQEQGKMEEAIALAQSEGAKAVKQRAVEVEAATGAMERGWRSLVNVVQSAWSAMKDVGRESLLQQVAAQKKLIEEIRSGEQNGDIGAAQRYLVTLEGQVAAEKKAAEGGAARAASMKGFLVTEKEVAAAQERGAKQTRTLTQALGEYREIRHAGITAGERGRFSGGHLPMRAKAAGLDDGRMGGERGRKIAVHGSHLPRAREGESGGSGSADRRRQRSPDVGKRLAIRHGYRVEWITDRSTYLGESCEIDLLKVIAHLSGYMSSPRR